jgi:hypothetical protein
MATINIGSNIHAGQLTLAIAKLLGRSVNFSINLGVMYIHDDLTAEEHDLVYQAVIAHEAVDWALLEAKQNAAVTLDTVAEEIRSKYLTSAPLQAATYINKARDALAYKQTNYHEPFDPVAYPYVDSEMRAAGDTLAKTAADRILTEAAMYDSVKGAAIEYERRKGKIAVSIATTVEEVETAKNLALTSLYNL